MEVIRSSLQHLLEFYSIVTLARITNKPYMFCLELNFDLFSFDSVRGIHDIVKEIISADKTNFIIMSHQMPSFRKYPSISLSLHHQQDALGCRTTCKNTM